MAALALLTAACATSGGVPKPFPMPPHVSRGPTGSTEAEGSDSGPGPESVSPAEAAFDAYALVGTALSLRGTPYRNGGVDLNGFDCSGFTQYVFAHHSMSLPRTVREQFEVGKPVEPEDVTVGDLLFFSTTSPGATHVGIAIGGERFVHAPSSTGVVRVEFGSAPYWARRFVGARRVA